MHYSQVMELAKLTKAELMLQCEQQGITNYKSKSKDALIKLLEPKAIEKSIVNKSSNNPSISVENMCGLEYLKTLDPNSIDLILTDPPYIISKSSGLDKHYNNVKYNEANDINEVKSEEEWTNYKLQNTIEDDTHKSNYIKYGSIYGKKYCVKTDYGSWDSDFSLATLEKFIELYYSKLKKGGTLIMFFDLWKITNLKDLLEKYNFKQLRFIEWIKTNPQPRNSKVNYLTNTREIALLGVKDSNPTFNSSYDNGIYSYPLQGGKNRFHPTQKSLALFEELIKKHSNEGDTILDTFLGSGTTALACKNTKRLFKGCEIDKTYYDKIVTLLQ
uniref:DNA methylase N-4/N-6 domain-containing protein n=1 Tax=viral metagenome TaxID=1070528 RepID=A0A6C0D581_9ZZZZ